MKRKSQILTVCVFALATAPVVNGSVFDGGWRVSVGAAYNAPAKVGLHFSPVKFNCGRVMPSVGYPTREEAYRIVNPEPVEGSTPGKKTRQIYSADGKVFVDDDNRGKSKGGMEAGTWNVQVLYDSWNGESFELASAEYVEVREIRDGQGEMKLNGSDESAMPGVSVELSRNLYHNEEYHSGVDLAFLFSYFFRTDLYKSESRARSDALEVTKGKLTSFIAPDSGIREDNWRDDEGCYGAGSYYGPGPVFKYPGEPIDRQLSSSVFRNSAGFRASGDFRELEMILALRPYYDVFEWLRLYGTIGLAVSWSEFDLDVRSQRNEVASNYSRRYDAWDVYGIGGLGLMLRWKDFCLGADFFARFLQDDIEIEDEIVRGSLQRGTWMFRGMLGYEF